MLIQLGNVLLLTNARTLDCKYIEVHIGQVKSQDVFSQNFQFVPNDLDGAFARTGCYMSVSNIHYCDACAF